jgi:hypothetical protein
MYIMKILIVYDRPPRRSFIDDNEPPRLPKEKQPDKFKYM